MTGQPAPDEPVERAHVERALMDRFRHQATRDVERPPRRFLQHTVALGLALGLVLVVMLGFDRFLTSMQKFMEIEIEERAPAAQPAGEPASPEPIPAYVVPTDVSPPPQAGPDPRPNPVPAPDNAPATPR